MAVYRAHKHIRLQPGTKSDADLCALHGPFGGAQTTTSNMKRFYDILLALVLFVQCAYSQSVHSGLSSDRTTVVESSHAPVDDPVGSETHVVRVELREMDGSIRIETSGFLSDTVALGQLFLSDDENSTETITAFSEGFYLTSSALQSDMYSIETESVDLSGCSGFSDIYLYDIIDDEDVPSLGFDVDGEDTIISLPFRYKAGESLAGSAEIPFASLADLNVVPGDLCYVEWSGKNGHLQRIELAAASPLLSYF